MGAGNSKEYWRCQVERLLATDMSVRQWCEINRVCSATMYGWLSMFAECEPELFGGASNIADKKKWRWVESTWNNMRDAKAIVPALAASGFLVVDSADLTASVDENQLKHDSTLLGAITVAINGTTTTILPGTAKADIANVLSVVASL